MDHTADRPVANTELADALAELAAVLRARKADRFRVRAYEQAARMLRALPVEVTELSPSEVRSLEGIGPALAALVDEYVQTGHIRMLDDLRTDEPHGFGAMLRLPLLGIRDARTLAGTHAFSDVTSLRAAAADGLPHLDERLAGRVHESLRRLDLTVDEGMPWPLARRNGDAMAAALAAVDEVQQVIVAGGVRRGADLVDDFDLVVVGSDPARLAAAVPSSRTVVRTLHTDPCVLTVLSAGGRRARLWLTTAPAAGAALLWATGTPAHLRILAARAADAGMALRSDGLWRAEQLVGGAAEDDIYAALGLDVVPPQLREGAGGIDAARSGRLPRLVEAADLRGDLHVHSDWSRDGTASLDAMVSAAAGRGYEYVAITDHAENLRINGMTREAVAQRRQLLTQLRQDHAITILDAAELNIGADGALDYDLDFLLEFDMTVASIHSNMHWSVAQQTDRILAAIVHPAVTVIGHPTGRIIGHRPGYEIELTAIAQAAAETGTALEVNGSPRRLDLSGDMARIAVSAGALITVASDAHSVAELDYVGNGVPLARRGWASPADVLNTRRVDGLRAFAHDKKRR